MTTSSRTSEPVTAYVWVWLPRAHEPVVAGRLMLQRDGEIAFLYGRSYLDRDESIPLYLPELPLRRGLQLPLGDLSVPGCILDAGPDAWGQRVILARIHGGLTSESDTADLNTLTYLLESGSDRIGGLDFQTSATEYVPRGGVAALDDMVRAAEMVEAGEPLPHDLDVALLHGSSIGGARPKVLLDDGERKLIAKLSSRSDSYPVVKAEAVGLELARRVGLDVPHSWVSQTLGHDVLLVERFDRDTADPGARRLMVSALTILQLDPMLGRYASYADLADHIRERFSDPTATLRELFGRIVLNVCIGNIDDHARNHAAFWDGEELTLTPAYDLCPQPRSGTEVNQAIAIGRNGERSSQLSTCLAAGEVYALNPAEARAVIDHTVDVIESQWNEAAEAAQLTVVERNALWGRQILNACAFDGYR